jgi:ureidoacrylate peracid hydrolase
MLKSLAEKTCPETTALLVYGVAPEPGDPLVTKHRYSAFINTDLDLILRAQGIKSLILTGVATNGCVESTARDGFMLDYYVVFVDDCSATSAGPGPHAGTLANIGRGFGEVVKAADLMSMWAPVAEPEPALAAR